MIDRLRAGLAALLLALLTACTAFAQTSGPTFPALSGRVVDEAGILPADVKARIEARSAAFEQASSDQIVVAVVSSLQGYEIEEYGYRLGRSWGIGQGELDNGVILLVAPNERKVRIEVGYGLEGALPDIIAGQIIRDSIVPLFKAGDMPAGIEAGVAGIEEALSASPEDMADRLQRGGGGRPESSDGLPPEVVIIIIVIVIIIVISANNSGGGGGRGGRFRRSRGAWSSGPVIVHDWGGSSGGGFGGGGFSGGGFGGGGGSFGGGGASGSW